MRRILNNVRPPPSDEAIAPIRSLSFVIRQAHFSRRSERNKTATYSGWGRESRKMVLQIIPGERSSRRSAQCSDEGTDAGHVRWCYRARCYVGYRCNGERTEGQIELVLFDPKATSANGPFYSICDVWRGGCNSVGKDPQSIKFFVGRHKPPTVPPYAS
jgi:hypothetical protein